MIGLIFTDVHGCPIDREQLQIDVKQNPIISRVDCLPPPPPPPNPDQCLVSHDISLMLDKTTNALQQSMEFP